MKDQIKQMRNDSLILAGLSFAGGVIITIAMSTVMAMESEITRLENTEKQQVFVWNDDEESIPLMGAPVKLEFIQNDTIYIGPSDNASEYQFTVTDDSISVSDFGRPVGTVKIEGKLKQLIEQDNE
jgi:hypothetical protein